MNDRFTIEAHIFNQRYLGSKSFWIFQIGINSINRLNSGFSSRSKQLAASIKKLRAMLSSLSLKVGNKVLPTNRNSHHSGARCRDLISLSHPFDCLNRRHHTNRTFSKSFPFFNFINHRRNSLNFFC